MKLEKALKLVEAHPSKRFSFVFRTEDEARDKKHTWYVGLFNKDLHLTYLVERRGNLLTIARWL